METVTAKVKNTSKARKFNLEDRIVELVGEKSGLIIFKFAISKDLTEYFSIEEEAFANNFEFKNNIKLLPRIEGEKWISIKPLVKKFN